ncbi:MAG: Gfo/Idh/MocA family oxidoreductase [Acidobacteria bacterium]|nr:Gfo/Idh/MocA family oxidoreductase [Acidobacteriota bacterium]
MPTPLRIANIGLGRIGVMHALHAQEVAAASGGACVVTAMVEPEPGRRERAAAAMRGRQSSELHVFESIDQLLASGVSDACIVSTPTDLHRAHAWQLAEGGQRMLLEKPLTGTLADDREFAAQLDAKHPTAVMLAFQRRFDAPLAYGKQLMKEGAIGRVFKVVSILEDSNPAPDGYVSGGILPDMSVHNVDEILWMLDGVMPERAAVVGNCLYSRKLSTAVEDFDDAFLYLWFPGELSAQVSVTRNHVSGYRVETWLFGEEGQIHIGRFEHRHLEVMVEVYGRRDRKTPIEKRVFSARDYGQPLPEFVDRFGAAYKAEVEEFVRRCVAGEPFAVTHRDGVRAMEVIDAGMRCVITKESSGQVG